MIIETINAFGDKTKHENVKLMFITQYGLNIDGEEKQYTGTILKCYK